MAFENVNFKYPNFCIGPQSGTFCSINQDTATTLLQIKNQAGGTVGDYTLSSNILNDLMAMEYVGPTDLSGMLDDLTFFTLERIDVDTCIIKRYETRASSNQLNLKQQIVKSSTGSYYYDALGMSVEHYRRTFSAHNAGSISYLDIDDSSRVSNGDKLFLGPSDDTDNLDATESVTVNYVVGNRVYLNSNITYQYVSGDPITFYKNIYLISNKDVGGGDTKGTVFKIDSDTGAVLSVTNDGIYKDVSASKWFEGSESISMVRGANILFVQPYVSYLRWRSQNMNNIEDDKSTVIPVVDIVFDGSSVYKLMNKITKRDDTGDLLTYSWTNYNFQQDTLAPYSNVIRIYTNKQFLIGPTETTTFNVKVIDQFGIGLGSKDVNFYITSGDTGGEFDPLSGVVTTNTDGEATIDFTSSAIYTGHTIISARTDGGLPANGSAYVWDNIDIISIVEVSYDGHAYQTVSGVSSTLPSMRQVESEMDIDIKMFGRTFFTSPEGDWINPSIYASEVPTYLPGLIVGPGDGPVHSFDFKGGINPEGIMPNRITQVLDFESLCYLRQILSYESTVDIRQHEIVAGDLQISQLKLSLHTYWVSGVAYDELFTTTTLSQFIFVSDAIPPFWSEKNNRDTYIWIKLRPNTSDLEPQTVSFLVREVSFEGDTGFVDYTSQLTITTFVDISGNIGLELTLPSQGGFHHNAVVYVHIEVDDALGNHIWIDYFFSIIADYKLPYLENLSPSREQALVQVDSDIYFEIKDEGKGVDIDSLDMTVNSRAVTPTSIVKIDDNHYKVTYNPSTDFYYNKSVQVGVKIKDLSEQNNYLNDTYRFYTVESDAIWLTEFKPEVCKRGINPSTYISFLALGSGSGVDKDTIVVQVKGKDVTNRLNLLPVIYRIS